MSKGKRISNNDIWKIFDTEKINKRISSIELDTSEIIHRNCTLCDSLLTIMEDGFPTCTNSKCSLICRNIIDYSPEWRFYASNDKTTADPTRCGNPINPLLKESSFGCKILCDNKSSYEISCSLSCPLV
jgi:hypothetical protein